MTPPQRFPLSEVQEVVTKRGEGEEELWQALCDARFDGRIWGLVATELARHGIPVLGYLIRFGQIFERTKDLGRPVDRGRLRNDDEIPGLVHLVLAAALKLFRENAAAGKGWNPQGGTSMASFFIGTCVLVFANAYRWWSPDHDPRQVPVEIMEDVEAPEPPISSEEVRRLIKELTGCTDEEICTIVQMKVDGFTIKEISDALGKTPRAVDGRLNRFLKSIRKRGNQS